jgi:predicted enzyme related to lactoylglutathione lyase
MPKARDNPAQKPMDATKQEQPNSTAEVRPRGVDASLARHGGLSYLQIPAIDIRQSADFYSHVLGWRVEHSDSGDTKFSDPSGHLIGRWIPGRKVARSSRLTPYFYVNRIDDAVAGVIAHGGEIVKAPYAEGNLRIATVRDPAGNFIGLWQDAER